MSNILERLAQVLEERKTRAADASYVSSLYAQGLDAILKKVGEEATETILAAKGNDHKALIHETADLWFHTLVMLAAHGLGPEDVLNELEQRFGISGLDEQVARARSHTE